MFGFRDVEIPQAIVQAGGIRAAAARSGMSRSAMSTWIAAFERRLGVRPFDRLGCGVRLSTAGRRSLEASTRPIAATSSRSASVIADTKDARCTTDPDR